MNRDEVVVDTSHHELAKFQPRLFGLSHHQQQCQPPIYSNNSAIWPPTGPVAVAATFADPIRAAFFFYQNLFMRLGNSGHQSPDVGMSSSNSLSLLREMPIQRKSGGQQSQRQDLFN